MGFLSKEFRDKVKSCKDVRMSMEREEDIAYPTGFLPFDFLNGNIVRASYNGQDLSYYNIGIVDGSVNFFVGRTSSGKTTFVLQSAANIIRGFEESVIFHDDIEGGVIEERKVLLTKMSVDELEKRYIHRNTGITAENVYERIKLIHDIKLADPNKFLYDTGKYDRHGNKIIKMQPTIYIIDSLNMLMPEKFLEEEKISGQMSSTASAKMNSMLFKRLVPMLKATNIIILLIGHLNDFVTMTPKANDMAYLKQDESVSGGKTPKYVSNLMVKFYDKTKLKQDEMFKIDGQLVTVEIIKSRSNRSGRDCTLVFNKDLGFDVELSTLITIKEAGLLNGAGLGYYIGDFKDEKFSMKGFKAKLRESSKLQEIFVSTALQILESYLLKIEQMEIEEANFNLYDSIMNKIDYNINKVV